MKRFPAELIRDLGSMIDTLHIDDVLTDQELVEFEALEKELSYCLEVEVPQKLAAARLEGAKQLASRLLTQCAALPIWGPMAASYIKKEYDKLEEELKNGN